MAKKEFNWMILFYVGITVVFVWLVLKELGYINTPELVRILPYIGGFVAIFGFAKEFGRYIQKIDTLILDVAEMKKDVHNIDKRVSVLESLVNAFDKRLIMLEAFVRKVVKKFSSLETK